MGKMAHPGHFYFRSRRRRRLVERDVLRSRQAYMQTVYVGNETNVARILAGKAVSPEQITADLMSFEAAAHK